MPQTETSNNNDIIDLARVIATLWAKKRKFLIAMPIVFVLACVWIFPEPRYYRAEVALAPEGGESDLGGLASVASTFGVNLGDMASADAIYPTLYPDLFESTNFIVGLFDVRVTTDDHSLTTDYYTYLKRHQKRNWLTKPFNDLKLGIASLFITPPSTGSGDGGKVDPFRLSKADNDIVETIKSNISCSVDKKTNVIAISVKDQDRLVCALLADSIRSRLQTFIIDYRTKKAKQDVAYYQHLTDSARTVYEKALVAYGSYNDAHRNVALQTYVEQGERLKNDLDVKLGTYNALATQLATARAKVQERTPSFTTLRSATVPQKPAGPKRVMFVLGMCVFVFFVMCLWLARKELFAGKRQ